MDAINRLPQTGIRGITLKQQLKDKLIIDKYGEELPETRKLEAGQSPTVGLHPIEQRLR